MTFCIAMKVSEGLVGLADTRKAIALTPNKDVDASKQPDIKP